MSLQRFFRCPRTGQPLTWSPTEAHTSDGEHSYPLRDGMADFYIEDDTSCVPQDDANRKWLSATAMEGRDLGYRRHREWPGVGFMVEQVALLSRPGGNILEVGAGTGHFTRWMAEACGPDRSIYAFDFSWPALERTKIRTEELGSVCLFCANARGAMPTRMRGRWHCCGQGAGGCSQAGATTMASP